MAQQAQDTFVAEVNGVPVLVQKGQVLADSHPLVKLHGVGVLFRPLDLGDGDVSGDAKPKRGRPTKAEAEAKAAAKAEAAKAEE